MPRDMPRTTRFAYVASLANALDLGCNALRDGRSSLDAVELVVASMEGDPLFNAGRGAVLTQDGHHELDASIMNGRDRSCGAVAAVRTVEHPISLARLVMERTRHVLLVGEGAEAFAREMQMPAVDNAYFTTERRRQSLAEHLASPHGTVGAVALDREGHLAAATSTGGLTGKRWGRVGDSPIIGAGTYADDATCAVSGTGTGEEFIRHAVASSIAARMEHRGETVTQAAHALVHDRLRPDDGGVIALSHTGEIAFERNTDGMYRGACDSSGLFEVLIWDANESAGPAETAVQRWGACMALEEMGFESLPRAARAKRSGTGGGPLVVHIAMPVADARAYLGGCPDVTIRSATEAGPFESDVTLEPMTAGSLSRLLQSEFVRAVADSP